jgi:hypothetical protein
MATVGSVQCAEIVNNSGISSLNLSGKRIYIASDENQTSNRATGYALADQLEKAKAQVILRDRDAQGGQKFKNWIDTNATFDQKIDTVIPIFSGDSYYTNPQHRYELDRLSEYEPILFYNVPVGLMLPILLDQEVTFPEDGDWRSIAPVNFTLPRPSERLLQAVKIVFEITN